MKRNVIGMEISHGGIGCVVPVPSGQKIMLERVTWCPLPDKVLRHTMREPQVLEPEVFLKVLREAWGGLHLSQRRVALSLPDSAGRLLLTTLDTPLKNRGEALEILRWKLAKRLGVEADDLHLDFQLLREHESGACDVIAEVILRPVILQYEELFAEAGLQPFWIGFHTLNLLRLFKHFPAGEGHLAILYDNCFSMVALSEGRHLYCRSKSVAGYGENSDLLRRELVSSLAACRQACSGTLPGAAYCLAPPSDDRLPDMLTSTFGERGYALQAGAVIEPNPALVLDAWQTHRVSAAVGAALGGGACR